MSSLNRSEKNTPEQNTEINSEIGGASLAQRLARIQGLLSDPQVAAVATQLAGVISQCSSKIHQVKVGQELGQNYPVDFSDPVKHLRQALQQVGSDMSERVVSALADLVDCQMSGTGKDFKMKLEKQMTSAQKQKGATFSKDLLRPVSGFLEYVPAVERSRQEILEKVIGVYKSYGYLAVNTPEVERLDILLNKGEDVGKEIYVLDRITRDESAPLDARLALRFDLTVPLARYVARHQSAIAFPFKRYQAQSCFRGERPQDGRYRQFLQCDVDIIGNTNLPIEADLEVAEMGLKALEAIGVKDFTFRLSNRILLQGIMEILEVSEPTRASRVLDKLAKIGEPAARALLLEIPGMREEMASALLDLGRVPLETAEELRTLVSNRVGMNEKIREGLEQTAFLLEGLQRCKVEGGRVVVDLSVIRGLDYYTGSVFEVTWEKHRNIGSIAAGGRYDNLTGQYASAKYPGVGFSLGFSRVFDKLVTSGVLNPQVASPSKVFVARVLDDGGQRAREIAETLRGRGIETEVALTNDRLDKQLRYVNRLGIPYVIFDAEGSLKEMSTGAQGPVDLSTWMPGTSAE
jgi:histidyl-tRNA synthetase